MSFSNQIFSIMCVVTLHLAGFGVCWGRENTGQQSGIAHNETDTSKITEISEVTVTETMSKSSVRATAPLQVIAKEDIKRLNALQVSDAVKHFSGVTVKDYGGIGGLKTVSVRSLGASHTAVSYDGMVLNDIQNGQIDIGRLSLDNVDAISLANGQSDKIFQPARLFASAAVLNIQSAMPRMEVKKIRGKAAMKVGSFGLVNPSLLLDSRISKKLALSVNGELMMANGKYPYLLHYGSEGQDSVSRETRQNTDVNNWKGEATLYGKDTLQEGYVKMYYYHSERGLPGATIFYNTLNFSSQRLTDDNIFVQGRYERAIGERWAVMANSKYNYAYTYYLDPVYLSSSGKEENQYRQHEVYASLAARYNPIDNLQFSVASDASYSTLSADLTDFAQPTRWLSQSVVAGKYINNWVTATASCLLTAVSESVKSGDAAKNRVKASPYVSASFKPFGNINLRLRVFYKNIFRLPTFNDLYYSKVGNRNLRPETTDQYNIGITYQTKITKYVPLLILSADGYHNNVKDKIVAYPTKNIYTWTMLNYGLVSVDGIDLSGEIVIAPHDGIRLSLGASHSYNRALNMTNPDGKDYKHQIPYTPRVSGSGHASVETPWFTIGYSMVWSGHRYAVNQNYAENRVEGYADHTLSVSHEFVIRQHRLSAKVECLNLTNKNYEVVRYFPMPGRSWRATAEWRF